MTLPSSTETVLYVSPSDFNLVLKGIKTATTRLGDRSQMWPVGCEVELVNNDDITRRLRIRIVYNEQMTLDKVDDRIANTVGGYGAESHFRDFNDVYEKYHLPACDVDISLVGFFVL